MPSGGRGGCGRGLTSALVYYSLTAVRAPVPRPPPHFDVHGSSGGAPLALEALEHLGKRRQGGRTWQAAAILAGPFICVWTCGPGPKPGPPAGLRSPVQHSCGRHGASVAAAGAAIKSVTFLLPSAQASEKQNLLQPLNAPGFSRLAQLGGGERQRHKSGRKISLIRASKDLQPVNQAMLRPPQSDILDFS